MKKPKLQFLHGYYGSHLFNGSQRKFINISQVLPFQPAPRLDEWPHLDAEIIRTAGFGPIQQSVYKKPMHKLWQSGFDVSPYAYDWRKSIRYSATQLLDVLEKKSRPRYLLGHSMGGLVLLSALTQGVKENRSAALKNISGMIFVATPFKGLPVLFRNFLIGTPFYYNPWYLRPEVLNTYESPFEMLPDHVAIKTPDGNESLDTTNVENWNPWLEYFSSPVLGDPIFKEKIQKAREFRKHLQEAAELQPDFPLMVVQARGKRTPAAYEILPDGTRQLDHWHLGPFIVPRKNFLSEDGDRTVLFDSQFLPGSLQDKATTFTTESGHLEVLESPKALSAISDWAKSH